MKLTHITLQEWEGRMGSGHKDGGGDAAGSGDRLELSEDMVQVIEDMGLEKEEFQTMAVGVLTRLADDAQQITPPTWGELVAEGARVTNQRRRSVEDQMADGEEVVSRGGGDASGEVARGEESGSESAMGGQDAMEIESRGRGGAEGEDEEESDRDGEIRSESGSGGQGEMADGEEIRSRGWGGAEGGEEESEEGADQDKLADVGSLSTGELNILVHRSGGPRPQPQQNAPPKWSELVDRCIKRHGLGTFCNAAFKSEELQGAPHLLDLVELNGAPLSVDFDKARRHARDKVAEVLGFMTDIGWILPIGEGNDNVDDAAVLLGDNAPVLPFPARTDRERDTRDIFDGPHAALLLESGVSCGPEVMEIP